MAVTFNPFTGNLDFIDTTAAAGSDTEIQFNDGGKLAGDDGLVFNKTSNKLTTKGDVELNDGGTYVTTLQLVTPTAARTISFPDATGTVGLVAGSTSQFVYNNAGAYAGVSTMTFDGTSVTLAGRLINSYTSLASSPAKVFTGTWFTGGTATTTKPHFLIEPTGATSTAWSTSGTGLGVNAASGFTGRLLDLQLNGTSNFNVDSTGRVSFPLGAVGTPSLYPGADTNTGFWSPAADTLAASTNGSERARIDSSGRLLVGTSSARSNFYNTTAGAAIQIEGQGGTGDSRRMSIISCDNSATAGGGLVLGLQRSGAVGGNTIVQNGDYLGVVSYMGNDGSEFVEAARISGEVDGTPGSNDMPGRLVFSTTADGASSPTERMRLTSTGQLRLAGAGITFNGDTAAANELDDYEEGTWTPVYTPTSGSFTTMTMNVQSARYTKIGNLVTAEAYIVTLNVDATGASGSVNITGLPFTSYSAQSLRRSGAIGFSSSFSTAPVFWGIQENTTTINLYEARADALDVADLTTGAGSFNIIWLSVSYTTA
jgi:hypothetical protein